MVRPFYRISGTGLAPFFGDLIGWGYQRHADGKRGSTLSSPD